MTAPVVTRRYDSFTLSVGNLPVRPQGIGSCQKGDYGSIREAHRPGPKVLASSTRIDMGADGHERFPGDPVVVTTQPQLHLVWPAGGRRHDHLDHGTGRAAAGPHRHRRVGQPARACLIGVVLRAGGQGRCAVPVKHVISIAAGCPSLAEASGTARRCRKSRHGWPDGPVPDSRALCTLEENHWPSSQARGKGAEHDWDYRRFRWIAWCPAGS